MSDLIDRQAAIDAFDKQIWGAIDIPICKEIRTAVKKTIEQLPSAEKRTNKRTETHECDCISRQAAIDAVCQACDPTGYTECDCYQGKNPYWCDEVRKLRDVPVVADLSGYSDKLWAKAVEYGRAQERKKGRWIKKNDVCSSPFDMTDRYVCSVCGLGYNWGSATSANYCPNCGAKMEVEEQ